MKPGDQGRIVVLCSRCGKRMASKLETPLCRSCRQALDPRGVADRAASACVDCGKKIRWRARYSETRCFDCSRKRREAAPHCTDCGGAMSNHWYYRWLAGKASMPPLCHACKDARLADPAPRGN